MDSSRWRSKIYAEQTEAKNVFPRKLYRTTDPKEISLLCAQNLQNSSVFLGKLEGSTEKNTFALKKALKKHFLIFFCQKKSDDDEIKPQKALRTRAAIGICSWKTEQVLL